MEDNDNKQSSTTNAGSVASPSGRRLLFRGNSGQQQTASINTASPSRRPRLPSWNFRQSWNNKNNASTPNKNKINFAGSKTNNVGISSTNNTMPTSFPTYPSNKSSGKRVSPQAKTSVKTPTQVYAVSSTDEALGCFRMDYEMKDGIMHAMPRKSYDDENKIQHSPPAQSDWILDGHAEWQTQYQKTQELLEELYPSSPQELDETSLLLELGSPLGTQEYQFAQFDSMNNMEVNGAVGVDGNTVTTTPTTATTNHPEFKQFWKQAVTAPTPSATFDMGSTESAENQSNENDPNFPDNVMDPIDKFLLEKMAAQALGRDILHHGNDDNTSDDDDFGDFQQAEAEASVESNVEEDNGVDDHGDGDDAVVENDVDVVGDNDDDVAVMKQANPQDDDGHDHQNDNEHNVVNEETVVNVAAVTTTPKRQDIGSTNDATGEESAVPLQQAQVQGRPSSPQNFEKTVEDDQDSNVAKPSASPAQSISNECKEGNDADSVSNNSAIEMPNASPPPKQYSDERYQCTPNNALPIEPPTPITRNYYQSPPMKAVGDDDSASSAPSPRRKFQFEPENAGDDSENNDNEESASREESILWTQHSQQEDHSIPKEVQLVTNRRSTATDELPPTSTPAKDTISIPQTVRISSTTASPYTFPTPSSLSSPSFYFGRNASSMAATSLFPQYYGKESDNDEPSISSSIASPEVKFLRRHHRRKSSGKHQRVESYGVMSWSKGDEDHDGSNPNDDDDGLFDEEESVSLGSLGTMPENYLKHPDLDYTMQELNKLEWDWLPFWKMDRLLDEDDSDTGEIVCDTSKIPLLQEQITQRLSKLDVFYNKVEKKVYQKIQPHSDELAYANQATLDSQKNLQLAQMYLSRTQEAIQQAKYGAKTPSTDITAGLGVYGAMQLLDSWDKLASQQGMSSVVQTISDIFDLEAHILARIKAFDTYQHNSSRECQAIVDLVAELKEQGRGPTTSHLQCLDDLRKRAEEQLISTTLLGRLHELLEEMVALWCTESNDSNSLEADLKAYERLMDAFQLVFNESSGKEEGKKDPHAFSSAICTTIHTALLLEAQKAFGRALLSPSNDASEEDEAKSKYATELDALRYHENNFLDAARIPIWTHNAVTIRFDFEMKDGNSHPLPHVFHKLCWLLTNTLFGMKRIMEWNDTKSNENHVADDTLVHLIRQELPKRRASLWNACVQSLEGCIEEYLKFLDNKKLFSWDGDTCDDSNWMQDLEGLQDVLMLSRQFLSLDSIFLQGVPAEFVNDGSMIREKLDTCCKRHVRTFHVATMNSLGGMLYREDWHLLLSVTGSDVEEVSRGIIQELSCQLFQRSTDQIDFKPHSAMNGFQKTENGFQVAPNHNSTNPFDKDTAKQANDASDSPSTPSDPSLDWSDEHTTLIMKTLTEYLGGDSLQNPAAMTKSMIYGILPWCARIFVLIDKLPSMSSQAMLVLSNIFDLYITTAFRLAAGSSRNERTLLGLDTSKQILKSGDIDILLGSRFASQSFGGFGRRSSQQSTSSNPTITLQQISSSVEAEMACFVAEEAKEHDLSLLCDLLMDGQRNLQGIAKLDLVDSWIADPKLEEDTDEEQFALFSARVLEQRAAAAFNVVCLAATLHLSAIHLGSLDGAFLDYRDKFVKCMPTFLNLSNRMITMRAICGKAIVTEIVSLENVWEEESKLHEQPNDYVENLCDFCCLLWESVCSSPNRLPNGLLESLWDDIVSAGLMTMIEGFSKVPYCSTEGRALMSMDVAAYRSLGQRMKESSKAPSPTRLQPYRTIASADTFIKMFYFPHKEAVTWIEENYGKYHYPHIFALVLSTATNAAEARKAIQMLNGLYGNAQNGISNSSKEAKMVRL